MGGADSKAHPWRRRGECRCCHGHGQCRGVALTGRPRPERGTPLCAPGTCIHGECNRYTEDQDGMVRYTYVVVAITQILASFVHRLSNTHWASPQMSGGETTIKHASL